MKSPEGAQGVAAELPAPLRGSEIFGGLHPGFPRLWRVHPGLLPDAPAGAESLFLVIEAEGFASVVRRNEDAF